MHPEVLQQNDRILVVNPLELQLEDDSWYSAAQVSVPGVPRNALMNLDPYRIPEHSIAGGGFVIKHTTPEPEILLIFRRGCWDIPKGKLDKGESIEQCAVREVQEEVGIEDVTAIQPLGYTWHGFDRKGAFYVKQTYWYEMRTSETHFSPQAEEDIEDVAWFPWSQAKERVDFPVLSLHMKQVEKHIHSG